MRFRLVRYFTVTSLVAFVLVAAALMFFERQQSAFFKEVQKQQAQLLQTTQESFARHEDDAARRGLLAINENGSANLSRLFANTIWERDFAPFLARTQRIDIAHCRAIPDLAGRDGKPVATPEKKACFAGVGKRIRVLPGFQELDARVFSMMSKSTVFKVKMYDLRGITIYSSDPKQVGEDKSSNAGWKSAIDGKLASQLSHRDQFGAFEGIVHHRDLIESYVPIRHPSTDEIVGALEVYADVTNFLKQIEATSASMKKAADANQAKVAAQAAENQQQVEKTSSVQIAIVVGLLMVLYGALFVIVKRAQKIIEEQESDRAQVQQQLAQAEKMASLGQMVAGVAHQLNTPLAFSQSNVLMVKAALQSLETQVLAARAVGEILADAEGDRVLVDIAAAKESVAKLQANDVDFETLQQMLGDVLEGIRQMSELVVNLRDFTRLDQATTAQADINKSVHAVVYIAKSVISNTVEVVEEYSALSPVEGNISQLNQVFLNLINNAAQAIEGTGKITVRTGMEGARVRIDIADTGKGIAPDVLPRIFDLYYTTKPAGEGTGLGLHIARDIVTQHGGEIRVKTGVGVGTTVTVYLPASTRAEIAKAA